MEDKELVLDKITAMLTEVLTQEGTPEEIEKTLAKALDWSRRVNGQEITTEAFGKVLDGNEIEWLEERKQKVYQEGMKAAADSLAKIVELIDGYDLIVEDHIRLMDCGLALTEVALTILINEKIISAEIGLKPSEYPLCAGICRHPYIHPLSGKREVAGGVDMHNSWSTSSHLINIAMRWLPGKRDGAVAKMQELVEIAVPELSAPEFVSLFKEARYSDPKLMELTSLVQQGLMKEADSHSEEFGHHDN